jgi:chemotaxis protein methyltransferase CheR
VSWAEGSGSSILSSEDLQRFCELLYRRTGISYGETKRYYIERRVADRMQQLGTHSFPAYMAMLRANGSETEALINSFTVNETYFYREHQQLNCLAQSLLPEIVAKRGSGDLVRIWSVPCSTGEEPYSIAIWLLENWKSVDVYNIEIVGSDIDTRVLADAMVGEYGERALARLSPEVVARYFEPAMSGGGRRIIQDLRESVKFTTTNLVDASTTTAQGQFDIIFCRNVLIYFDEASRLVASRNLYEALNPNGFICLGHSESMARVSDRFEARRFPDAVVYQRRKP